MIKPKLDTLLEAVPHNARETWIDGAYFSDSKIRKRVELIFGSYKVMKGKCIGSIGLARALLKIGRMNLVSHVGRYEQLTRLGVSYMPLIAYSELF